MYYEMKTKELSFADLLRATGDRPADEMYFPYKSFVCRCGNCRYLTKGRCSLQKCCCMKERAKAGSCSFSELMNHCFANIKDNIFRYRLRLASERISELCSCFLSKEHRKRFMKGCALTRRQDNGFIAQLFLLSADERLWNTVLPSLFRHRVGYESIDVCAMTDNAYALLCMAYDMETGTSHTDIGDLCDEEVVDFDTFCVVCCAFVIAAFGNDAVRIAAKRRKDTNGRETEQRR